MNTIIITRTTRNNNLNWSLMSLGMNKIKASDSAYKDYKNKKRTNTRRDSKAWNFKIRILDIDHQSLPILAMLEVTTLKVIKTRFIEHKYGITVFENSIMRTMVAVIVSSLVHHHNWIVLILEHWCIIS